MSHLIIKKNDTACIVKITKRGIYISPASSCIKKTGCHSCTACNSDKIKPKFFYATKEKGKFTIGQCIQITYHSFNEAFAAFVVFGIPILSALLVFLFINTTNPDETESGWTVFSAVAAFAGGFFIVYIIEKLSRFFFPISINLHEEQYTTASE